MENINYGIDAPSLARNFFIGGSVLCLFSIFLSSQWAPAILSIGISFLATALLMLLYSKKGKLAHRNRMLNLFSWTGDEQVLDVGTGRGLLMNGAAKKITNGKVNGIDNWKQKDLSKNTATQAKLNAIKEGVTEKIDIKNKNILSTGFQNNAFDVILSSLCLHNIHGKQKRKKACKEIYRILKHNGTVIISDIFHSKEYEKTFLKLGMKTEKIGIYYFSTFPPQTIIKAIKK